MVDLSMGFGMFTGGYPLKALDPDPKKQPPALRKASSKGQPAAQVQRAQQAQQGQTWPATGRHSQPSRSKGWTCTTWELTTNTYLWCSYKKSKHYVHIQLCAFLWKYIHIYIYIDTGVHGELVLFPQTTGYSNDWGENYGSPERNKYHPNTS